MPRQVSPPSLGGETDPPTDPPDGPPPGANRGRAGKGLPCDNIVRNIADEPISVRKYYGNNKIRDGTEAKRITKGTEWNGKWRRPLSHADRVGGFKG